MVPAANKPKQPRVGSPLVTSWGQLPPLECNPLPVCLLYHRTWSGI